MTSYEGRTRFVGVILPKERRKNESNPSIDYSTIVKWCTRYTSLSLRKLSHTFSDLPGHQMLYEIRKLGSISKPQPFLHVGYGKLNLDVTQMEYYFSFLPASVLCWSPKVPGCVCCISICQETKRIKISVHLSAFVRFFLFFSFR